MPTIETDYRPARLLDENPVVVAKRVKSGTGKVISASYYFERINDGDLRFSHVESGGFNDGHFVDIAEGLIRKGYDHVRDSEGHSVAKLHVYGLDR